jgi:hypothetical protein
MDTLKQYHRNHDAIYLPKVPLSDELKLHGRTIPLKTSAFDSPYLQIERARIALEEECHNSLKDYYDAVILHIQRSYSLPSAMSMDLAHAIARLISSESVYYHRP